MIEIRSAFDNRVNRFEANIVSYSGIQITQLTAKTDGTIPESFALKNNNAYPVKLAHWDLRSLTSKTHIPVTGSIEPYQSLVVTANNRLSNNGGAYGLYNESNELVDVVTYSKVESGDRIERDGILWMQPDHSKAKDKPTSENEGSSAKDNVDVSGIVSLPNGRTIDIVNDQGEAIRIVLHPSFSGVKPRLHKGDRIRATGIWKKSRRGIYLSVREGDTLLLLYEIERVTAKKAKTDALLINTISPISGLAIPSPSRALAMPILTEFNPSLPNPTALWWVHAAISMVGFGLILPFQRQRTV
jgi:hypothetical protein